MDSGELASVPQPTAPATRWQRWGRLVVGTALSLLFLYLAVRGVRLEAVWAALTQANLLLLVVALTLSTGVNVAKAIRWQVILQPYARAIGVRRLFAVLMIGQALNTFAPLRVGDIARAYLVEGIGVGTVFFSVVIEKAFDSLLLLVLLFGVATFMPLPTWLKQSGILLSLVLVGVLLGGIVAGRGSRYIAATGMWLESHVPSLRRLGLSRRAASIADVVRYLSQGHLLLSTTVWTLACWLPGIAANYVAFFAMGTEVNTPTLAAVFLILVLYLGAVVPSSPGKVGIFHYLGVISLALFSVDKTQALAYSIVLHLISYGPPALLGSYYFWRESQTRGRKVV